MILCYIILINKFQDTTYALICMDEKRVFFLQENKGFLLILPIGGKIKANYKKN